MARSLVHYRLFVGIDVAASTCAVSSLRPSAQPTRAITIKQTPAGFADRERQLLAIEPDPHAVLIVMEATGTYWMRLATNLVGAGFALSVINPPNRSGRSDRPRRCSRTVPAVSRSNDVRASMALIRPRVALTAWRSQSYHIL